MKQVYKFNVIYGGCLPFFKKDKNGNKTNEENFMYNLLSLDEEKKYINSTTYVTDSRLEDGSILPLQPCEVYLEMAFGSKFSKLVGIEPIKK